MKPNITSNTAPGSNSAIDAFSKPFAEAIIAATKGDKKNLKEEAADVIFHLFVMLSSRGVSLEDVLGELERREGKSGIVEKRERKKKPK